MQMASTETITTQVSLPPIRDVLSHTNGGRLLPKLTRSPTSSRKHKSTPSTNSIGSDFVSDQLPSLPTSSHSNIHNRQLRPDLLRNTSAPVVSTLNNHLPKANQWARTLSDSAGQPSNSQSNAKMMEPTVTTTLRPPGSGSVKLLSPELILGPALPTPQVISKQHFQQVHDLSNKRIATLEYMRKSHEGKRFWFNAVQFSKADISRLPSYTPSRLARRAQNYLLLGLSVPAVLDVHPQPHPQNTSAANAALASDFLYTLNTLLLEFESYQQLHPLDGSHVSSLTRARIPQMFRRAATNSRPRKSSGAPDTSQTSQISPPAMPEAPHHSPHFSIDTTHTSNTFTSSAPTLVTSSPSNININMSPNNFSSSSSFPPPGDASALNSTCLPNEGPYTHLLTPPLPFTPDFFSVFATLCDVLVDVYQRLLKTINTPSACSMQVFESFTKADARIRKVMVGGIVRDFEGAAREAAKRELMGVQKIVLGGLMGT